MLKAKDLLIGTRKRPNKALFKFLHLHSRLERQTIGAVAFQKSAAARVLTTL